MSFYFVPDSFVLTDDLKAFARKLGFSDRDIEQQEEKWRDHQYRRAMRDPVRCWRNWCRNAIKFGDVTPTATPQYRGISEISEEQRKADAAKAWAEMNKLKGIK